MKLYAGLDGGGTKTKLLILNEHKEVVYEAVAGPTSIDTVSFDVIKSTFAELFANFNPTNPISAIYAGLGGIADEKDKQRLVTVMKGLTHVTRKTLYGVDNDVNNALAGSLGHDQGMVLIAGTGSVVYGHHKNKTWRAGGISAKEGDPGSSYDLGFQALRHLGKVLDGRCPSTAFSQDLMNSLKVNDYPTLAKLFNTSTRTTIASLSQIVTRHHEDPYAQGMMLQGINELVLMVNTVYRRLGFEKTELGLVGSLANANTPYKANLIQAIKKAVPLITVIAPPRFEAVMGSALLAMALEKNI
jgi:N-acetylglucosamine kinase